MGVRGQALSPTRSVEGIIGASGESRPPELPACRQAGWLLLVIKVTPAGGEG